MQHDERPTILTACFWLSFVVFIGYAIATFVAFARVKAAGPEAQPMKFYMLKPIASTADWHIVEAFCPVEALEQADALKGTVEAVEISVGLNSSQFASECQ
jgi:hypothetical protein